MSEKLLHESPEIKIRSLQKELERIKRARSLSVNCEIKIERINIIANNVLYFDDNSDYRTALWRILKVINPDMPDGEEVEELNYIVEESEDIDG